MEIEKLKQKVENQSKLIGELTTENEVLYHQYNHLIIRNGKMLKRIDDLQKIIDDLHIRIEELQLINGNMMQLNDTLRNRRAMLSTVNESERTGMGSDSTNGLLDYLCENDWNELQDRWKKYPGQIAQNGPNIRKQVTMLLYLYHSKRLTSAELFSMTGIGGVTGARYVSTLKKFEMICYTGARKKGHYEITARGKKFIEEIISKREVFEKSSGEIMIPENESPLAFADDGKVFRSFAMDQNDL